MSPTIFRSGGYRFWRFPGEEVRTHVHAHHETGEAKFWLEPEIAVAQNYGLSPARLTAALRLVRSTRAAWQTHLGRRSHERFAARFLAASRGPRIVSGV